MKLEKILKEHYRREMATIHIPVPLAAMYTGIPRGESMAPTPFWMHLVFNSAAAAIVVMAIVGHLRLNSPLREVLTTVNEKYCIESALRQNIERLSGFLKYQK